MVVGNVYYIVSNYNENKFKALLEEHLSQSSSVYPNDSLIEQVIAAYLACEDEKKLNPDNISYDLNLDVSYVDKRNYTNSPVIGEPSEALKVFNELMFFYNLSR